MKGARGKKTNAETLKWGEGEAGKSNFAASERKEGKGRQRVGGFNAMAQRNGEQGIMPHLCFARPAGSELMGLKNSEELLLPAKIGEREVCEVLMEQIGVNSLPRDQIRGTEELEWNFGFG